MAAGNLLVAQGGGPTAVINCSLVGTIVEANKYKNESIKNIIGAVNSIDGLLEENFIDLGKESTGTLKKIYNRPGAALGSCRRKLREEDYGRIIEILKKYNVRYFLYIGGNGSMHTAHKVNELAKYIGYELNVIGIPKTIDNDLAFTDHCPGFGSAARFIAALTKEIGIDVESLPPPITVIETPGRNAGWLAASSSLAKVKEGDAPNLIYIPEKPFNMDSFLSDVSDTYGKYRRAVIVVCEGLKDVKGMYLGGVTTESSKDGFGRNLPGGAASFLAGKISENLKLRARHEKPGLAARASAEFISEVDKKEAHLAGITAVDYALAGLSGVMVTLIRENDKKYLCSTGKIPLEKVAISEKPLPDNYINSKCNYVTENFFNYCRPLIGKPLKTFGKFESHKFIIYSKQVME